MTLLTVVIPVRNEGENFRRTYGELAQFIPKDSRILVLYDSEDDTTLPILEELGHADSRVKAVRNKLGRGIPNALRTAFSLVKDGPVLVAMADLSDDLRLNPEMLKRYDNGARIVCASRYMPGGAHLGGPRIKKILSRLAGLSLYWLGCLPVRDATNNFRLYDAQFLRKTQIESSHGFEVALELTIKACRAGLEVQEIPAVWRDRQWGKSNFRLLRSLPYYMKWWLYGLAVLSRRVKRSRKEKAPTIEGEIHPRP